MPTYMPQVSAAAPSHPAQSGEAGSQQRLRSTPPKSWSAITAKRTKKKTRTDANEMRSMSAKPRQPSTRRIDSIVAITSSGRSARRTANTPPLCRMIDTHDDTTTASSKRQITDVAYACGPKATSLSPASTVKIVLKRASRPRSSGTNSGELVRVSCESAARTTHEPRMHALISRWSHGCSTSDSTRPRKVCARAAAAAAFAFGATSSSSPRPRRRSRTTFTFVSENAAASFCSVVCGALPCAGGRRPPSRRRLRRPAWRTLAAAAACCHATRTRKPRPPPPRTR